MMNGSDEISIDEEYAHSHHNRQQTTGLKHLPHWPSVNIEFEDLVYSVPDVIPTEGNKVILRSVSGHFRSNQLTAILGPSGAGKSTLLNVLAGYKCPNATGTVMVNGRQRNMRTFRKMSRYIMQEDVHQKMLTVREALMIAADLKLGNALTKAEKIDIVDEILNLLRLSKAVDTLGHRLSGGERKRLSIALELVNNPPVIFLDEPTTGLDDLSSSQCVALLQRIAHGGRTVICSVHTPSAKIFAMFDHVYILAKGQCVYQGYGADIVPFVQSIGLNCPLTYNPADFIIEVSSGEYGPEFIEKMVTSVENGRVINWQLDVPAEYGAHKDANGNVAPLSKPPKEEFELKIDPDQLQSRASGWEQFKILHHRMTLQMYRDSGYLMLKVSMHVFLGFVIGGLFYQMGNDASKTLFNFGFCFTIIIAFMYIPMMPILLEFPSEVLLLKREYFNQWYRLNPYYFAMLLAKLPMQLAMAVLYITMVYLFTGQPLESQRIAMFFVISVLVSLASESLGLLIASRLSVVNGMFVGPVLTVPLMLLAVYGIGNGKADIPIYVRALMSISYLRYGLEGIMHAIYGADRADMVCPEDELFCPYKKPKFLLANMGFEDVNFAVSFVALVSFYLLFNASAFLMIRRRLSLKTSNSVAMQYIGRFVKTHLNFSSY